MEDKFVVLTDKQLDDLIYFASYRSAKRACDNLFGGILPYLNRINEDNGKIIEDLDFVKLALQGKKQTSKKVEKANPLKNLDNLTDKQKESLQNAMKNAIEMNRLVNIPSGVKIPEVPRSDD